MLFGRGSLISLFVCFASFAAPSALDTARLLNQISIDPEACYRVNELSFLKDDVHVYLTAGYLAFAKPINGSRIAAVFVNSVDVGDAEILLIPPTRSERLS